MASEKVSFNISAADLGKIQLMVDKGIYTSRTDFLTKAVVNELSKNEDVYLKEKAKFDWTIGISGFTYNELLKLKEENKKVSVYVMGLFILDKKVTLELIQEVVEDITVHGKIVAPQEIIDFYKNK